MSQELRDLVKIDLTMAFSRGLGAMNADPAAVQAVLGSEQLNTLLDRHVRGQASEFFASDHREVLLQYARIVGQVAAHRALMDQSRPIEVKQEHIVGALGYPFPTVPPTS